MPNFLTRAMPGETPARVKHRNGYARALRAPITPQGSPPIDPRALGGLGHRGPSQTCRGCPVGVVVSDVCALVAS